MNYRNALGSAPKATPSGVSALAFEAGGTRLISAEEGGSIRVWELGSPAWQAQASELANRQLSADERRQFVGDGL